jgi:hypothetical protein
VSVLDNFEQVLAAAPFVVELVRRFQQHTRVQYKILVPSREPLQLSIEWWWQQSLALCTRPEHSYNRAYVLLSLANLSLVQHQYVSAVQTYCEALTSFARLSVISGMRQGLQGLASVAGLLHRPEEASWLGSAVSFGSTETLGDRQVSQVLQIAQDLLNHSPA